MGVEWAARFRVRANSGLMAARPHSRRAVTSRSMWLYSRRARRSSELFDDVGTVQARGRAAMRFLRIAFVGAIELRRRRWRTGASPLAGDLALSSAELCLLKWPRTNTNAGGLATLPAREPKESSPRVKAARVLTTRHLLKCPPAALAGPSPVTTTIARRDCARRAACTAPVSEHLRKIKDDQYTERHTARVRLTYN